MKIGLLSLSLFYNDVRNLLSVALSVERQGISLVGLILLIDHHGAVYWAYGFGTVPEGTPFINDIRDLPALMEDFFA